MNGMWRLAGAQRRVPWGVALTFDDGPSPEHTPALLDLLRDLDVRATFFVVGAQAHPDLVLRMRAEGHGIGSRSRFADCDRTRIDEEIEGGLVDLQLVLGRRTKLFRPPHGHIDWRVATAMRRARLDSWLWSVDAEDHVPGRTADGVVDRCRAVRERDVVRLRESGVTIEALPRIVELARSKHLDFVAL